MPGQEPAQRLEEQLFYRGRKFNFEVTTLTLPNGVVGNWECIRHPGGALAVPVTANNKFILVRQYRFAVQGRLLEFPAGTVEVNESPAVTIRREIEEETGYRASRWRDLGSFPLAPGYSDEYIYTFLAQDLEKLPNPPAQDDDEDIEIVTLSARELEAIIHDGGELALDAKSVCSYYLAKPFLDLD
ncbi:MAG: NUDIX hydrolase [Cyanobacteria bacterium P01_H01_bin.15]